MSERRLYRDKSNGLIFGVCSGLARYSQISVGWIRTAFVLGTFIFGPIFLLYFALAIALPVRFSGENEKDFGKQEFVQGMRDLEKHLKSLESRVQKLESYIVSDEFELQHRIWKLND